MGGRAAARSLVSGPDVAPSDGTWTLGAFRFGKEPRQKAPEHYSQKSPCEWTPVAGLGGAV